MKISVITLFPEMFVSPFKESIIKRAIEKGIIELEFVDLREFGIGPHKMVDDTPYGGGKGMVLKVDVVVSAIEKTRDKTLSKKQEKVILLSARGEKFSQKKALGLSKLEHLILICGHYEGFDQRVSTYVDEEISIGDFILTGGEIPAMLIIDSVSRLVKGVLAHGSSEKESFSPFLEYDQYTKPQEFRKDRVPEVLLSGNHKEIEKWQKENSLKITKKLRPDLIEKD